VKGLVIAEIDLENNEVPFITDNMSDFPQILYFPTPGMIGERYAEEDN